jgi:RNA polymerase sigma-70 factor, ECF subfamily
LALEAALLMAQRSQVEAPQADADLPPTLEFGAIYQRWFSEVSRWVRVMGGPQAEREDLAQDVFVIAHRRLPDFDGHNVPGWLYQITRHRVRDFRRLNWVKRLLSGGVLFLEHLSNDGPSPADSFETREKQALLEQLLGELNESERTALLLHEIDGYTAQQIAQIQGVRLNTVSTRIHRARKKLKAVLAVSERRERSGYGTFRALGKVADAH